MVDLILTDTRLLNVASAAEPMRADVLVRDGVISAIGAPGSLEAPGVEPVSLDGRLLGPGLWDEHLHFTQYVVQRRRFDLSHTSSAAEVVSAVRDELSRRPPAPGDIFVGYGFRDATWPDAPTRTAIDGLDVGIPIALISGDLHCAWLNARAASLLGVQTDDTGLLREGPWIEVADRLGEADALTPAAFRDGAAAAARRGVVGVVDYEHTDNATQWPARVAAGVDLLRVDASVWPDRLDEAIARGLRTGDSLDPAGLVTMGSLKVVVDGSLNTRTALCWDPYPDLPADHPHRCGIASVPVEQLRSLLTRAREAGLAAAVHAIGDRANTEVLDTFEQLGMRGIIEHAQLVAERDFARFAELGIIASVQPEHAMDDRDVADHHWAGRTGRSFAFASLHRSGAQLRLGSDAPVAPLDPWVSLAAATFRSRGNREPWHPEQTLPFDVAFPASTRGRTTISVGEVADLVVLERDPATASRDELRELPVAATLLAGRFTHNAL